MTVPQALAIVVAVAATAVGAAWVAFPGSVSVDPLTIEATGELRAEVLVQERLQGEDWGYRIDPFRSPVHRCAPVALTFDGTHLLRQSAARSPGRYAELDARLDQERRACADLARSNAGTAVPVVVAVLVASFVAVALLRGRGPALRPPPPDALAAGASPSVGGCRRCGASIDDRLVTNGGAMTRTCDRCLASREQLPLFLLWSVSAVTLSLGALFTSTGYDAVAVTLVVVGGIVPAFAVHLSLHEAGHAAAALALGNRDVRVLLGTGPRLGGRRLGRLAVELRLAPSAGLTLAPLHERRGFRWRTWCGIVAGPVATLAVVVAAWYLVPEGALGAGVRWLILGTGALLLVGNLWPIEHTTAVGPVRSDGLLLATVPFLDEAAIDEQLGGSAVTRVLAQVADGRAGELSPADLDAIVVGARSGNPQLVLAAALFSTTNDDWPMVVELSRAALALDPAVLPVPMPAALRSTLQNNLAWAHVVVGDVQAGGEADLASAAAVDAAPANPAYRGTRAEVLAATGRIDEARVMANALVDEAWTPSGEPRWEGEAPAYAQERHLTVAAVELRAGDLAAARQALDAADRHGADGVRSAALRDRLAALEGGEVSGLMT